MGPENKPKQFHKWTLTNLIEVSRELGILGEDVSKFSHALRDFRNYIHPPSADGAEIHARRGHSEAVCRCNACRDQRLEQRRNKMKEIERDRLKEKLEQRLAAAIATEQLLPEWRKDHDPVPDDVDYQNTEMSLLVTETGVWAFKVRFRSLSGSS